MNTRLAATHIIAAVLRGQGSLSSLLPQYQTRIADQDQGLLQELCFGTCRWLIQLDYQLNQLLEKPFKPKDWELRANLLCALYQLSHTRIPPYAAIDGAVENTRKLKHAWASKLSNGVLRNYLRRQGELVAQSEAAADSVRLSHPNWLLKRWKQQWPEHWASLAEANNQRPPMTLRVNRRFSERDAYLSELHRHQLAAQACPFSPDGIVMDQPQPVTSLPHFAEGWVSVQDEAAQLAATLLDPQPGERVLDACCAPGGKTCHLLEYQPQLAELVALDSDPRRLERVADNLQRLQLSATLVCGDAASPESWWDGKGFDRILADVPCSATGVIRRHPDIKALRTPEDIGNLAALQARILHSLWTVLKPGGTLVYATCSVLQEENSRQIENFCAQQADAVERKISAPWGLEQPCGRQLLPQSQGHDGFYYAFLTKTA